MVSNVTKLLILPRESADELSKATNSKSFQLPEFCRVHIRLTVALHQVVDENLKERPQIILHTTRLDVTVQVLALSRRTPL